MSFSRGLSTAAFRSGAVKPDLASIPNPEGDLAGFSIGPFDIELGDLWNTVKGGIDQLAERFEIVKVLLRIGEDAVDIIAGVKEAIGIMGSWDFLRNTKERDALIAKETDESRIRRGKGSLLNKSVLPRPGPVSPFPISNYDFPVSVNKAPKYSSLSNY